MSQGKVVSQKPIDLGEVLLSLKQWFFFLLGRWWIIVLAGVIGCGLGILITYLEKPKYESHLTFALEEGEGGMGGALSLAAEFGFNLGGSNNIFEGDNIISLLSSRRIIERVLLSVDTLNGQPITMADFYSRISSDSSKKSSKKLSLQELRLSKVSFPVGQPSSNFSYLQDSVLMNIYLGLIKDGSLNVGKPDKKLNLYEVSVVSPNERFTKVFTDKLIRETTEFYTELKSRKSRETLEILEQRVAQTKGNLGSAITSRAAIQDANINPAFQRAQAELQEKQADISAYGGAYGELYKNLELARYQYLKDIPLLQIIDGADYPMKNLKKGKLKTGIIYGLISGFLSVFLLTLIFIIVTEFKRSSEKKNQLPA